MLFVFLDLFFKKTGSVETERDLNKQRNNHSKFQLYLGKKKKYNSNNKKKSSFCEKEGIINNFD